MTASAYRFPNRKQLTRLPALASPLLHFNLAEELAQLRGRALWQRGAQRSSKTLAKYPDFHILLVLMKANSRMGTHHVDARISIHAIEGRIRVHLAEEVLEVSSGELVALDYARPHDVEAIEESAFLISISWPGGTKEERHAWKQNIS